MLAHKRLLDGRVALQRGDHRRVDEARATALMRRPSAAYSGAAVFVSPTTLQQLRNLGVHAMEHTRQVDRDQLLPGFHRVAGGGCREPADAGLVAGDVEPAKACTAQATSALASPGSATSVRANCACPPAC